MAWHSRIQLLTGYVVEDPELFGPEVEQFSHHRLVASWIFYFRCLLRTIGGLKSLLNYLVPDVIIATI